MSVETTALDLTVTRGNKATLTITVKDNSGALFDLTNYTPYMTIRTDYLDLTEEPLLTITGVVSSPTTDGVFIVTLLPTHSDSLELMSYYYDITITDGSTNIYTLYRGLLSFTYNVTN